MGKEYLATVREEYVAEFLTSDVFKALTPYSQQTTKDVHFLLARIAELEQQLAQARSKLDGRDDDHKHMRDDIRSAQVRAEEAEDRLAALKAKIAAAPKVLLAPPYMVHAGQGFFAMQTKGESREIYALPVSEAEKEKEKPLDSYWATDAKEKDDIKHDPKRIVCKNGSEIRLIGKEEKIHYCPLCNKDVACCVDTKTPSHTYQDVPLIICENMPVNEIGSVTKNETKNIRPMTPEEVAAFPNKVKEQEK